MRTRIANKSVTTPTRRSPTPASRVMRNQGRNCVENLIGGARKVVRVGSGADREGHDQREPRRHEAEPEQRHQRPVADRGFNLPQGRWPDLVFD